MKKARDRGGGRPPPLSQDAFWQRQFELLTQEQIRALIACLTEHVETGTVRVDPPDVAQGSGGSGKSKKSEKKRQYLCVYPGCRKQGPMTFHELISHLYVHVGVLWVRCRKPDCNEYFKRDKERGEHERDTHPQQEIDQRPPTTVDELVHQLRARLAALQAFASPESAMVAQNDDAEQELPDNAASQAPPASSHAMDAGSRSSPDVGQPEQLTSLGGSRELPDGMHGNPSQEVQDLLDSAHDFCTDNAVWQAPHASCSATAVIAHPGNLPDVEGQELLANVADAQSDAGNEVRDHPDGVHDDASHEEHAPPDGAHDCWRDDAVWQAPPARPHATAVIAEPSILLDELPVANDVGVAAKVDAIDEFLDERGIAAVEDRRPAALATHGHSWPSSRRSTSVIDDSTASSLGSLESFYQSSSFASNAAASLPSPLASPSHIDMSLGMAPRGASRDAEAPVAKRRRLH